LGTVQSSSLKDSVEFWLFLDISGALEIGFDNGFDGSFCVVAFGCNGL
jgi:hypothetical protein